MNRGSGCNAHLGRHLLELLRFGAAGQKELEDQAADVHHPLALRVHDQPFGDGVKAGGDDARPLPLLGLDDTETAGPGRFQGLVVAQGRNDDAVLPGDLQDGLPGLRFDLSIVYRQIDHFFTFTSR